MNPESLLQTPPLSLYIHIPWCVRKCPYCDFNSHEARDAINESVYITALMADLDQEIEVYEQREIRSIFFGGGTPSLFTAESIHDILEGIDRRLTVAADAEITLEANPGTFEQKKFANYRTAGINRLSIGIQSFSDSKLKRLGRIHDRSEAITAIETARAAGFDNINLDLMFGLPGQSVQEAIADIELACEFEPAHVSHYQLTIEPNTYFHKHTPALPQPDDIWDMQQRCHEILDQQRYRQYEVSAFARDERQSRHNVNYWHFGDYIGIGAGAHGKTTNVPGNHIARRWKQRQPASYMEQALRGDACTGSSQLEPSEILFEFLMNALRLREGFSYELFEQRTGIGRDRLLETCRRVDKDLLLITERGMKTSQRGFDFLNDLLASLLDHCRQVSRQYPER